MSVVDNLKDAFSGDYTRAQPQAPVLLGQGTSEVIQDPLLKDLYFGSQGSPGFLNQLQQAGSNLIGQNVPLQQTAIKKSRILARSLFDKCIRTNRKWLNFLARIFVRG